MAQYNYKKCLIGSIYLFHCYWTHFSPTEFVNWFATIYCKKRDDKEWARSPTNL